MDIKQNKTLNGVEYHLKKVTSANGNCFYELFCADKQLEISINLKDYLSIIKLKSDNLDPTILLIYADFLKFISENYVPN